MRQSKNPVLVQFLSASTDWPMLSAASITCSRLQTRHAGMAREAVRKLHRDVPTSFPLRQPRNEQDLANGDEHGDDLRGDISA